MYFEYGNLLLTRIPLGVQYFSLSSLLCVCFVFIHFNPLVCLSCLFFTFCIRWTFLINSFLFHNSSVISFSWCTVYICISFSLPFLSDQLSIVFIAFHLLRALSISGLAGLPGLASMQLCNNLNPYGPLLPLSLSLARCLLYLAVPTY